MYFQKPFSFKGRITRGEYILSQIIALLYFYTIELLKENYFVNLPVSNVLYKVFLFLVNSPAYYFIIAQGAKRCHDMGHNGWIQLYPMFVFVMMSDIGHRAENKWGNDPIAKVKEKTIEESS